MARFELIRLFFTKRGMIALAAFASIWFIILHYFVSSAVGIVSSGSFQDIAQKLFGAMGLSELLTWPVPELAIYWLVAAYLFPSFALFAASDQTCSDRTRGTLRFISLRATRSEILIGRFIGQTLIISILVAFTLIATVIMASYRDIGLFSTGLTKALILFVDINIISLPFIAMMTFLNSFLRSSKMAIVICSLIFALGPLFISLLTYKLSMASSLTYIFPGVQISDAIGQSKLSGENYIVPIIQTACYLAVANLIMKRSSL